MRIAKAFLDDADVQGKLAFAKSIKIEFYGSLALTGEGHGSSKAVVLGLLGETPEDINPDNADNIFNEAKEAISIKLLGKQNIDFCYKEDVISKKDMFLDKHSNGMKLYLYNEAKEEVFADTYYSIGGGFFVTEDNFGKELTFSYDLPYKFKNSRELIALCKEHNKTIAQIIYENECVINGKEEVCHMLDNVIRVMEESIDRGCSKSDILPGGLKIKRRAGGLYNRLTSLSGTDQDFDPLFVVDWINVWAFAVSEENAAGGQIITAPTNGASGVIPAVLMYYKKFASRKFGDIRKGMYDFILTASVIGNLFKTNASISGAEVGCQGEVGVACSMAAGGLVAAMGGTMDQIENAAEIGIEHNLGLTCDPVGGLVQVPCIERNAMAAIKAVTACRMAMKGDGSHFVTLDAAIETMYQTGLDMQAKYKETSIGGLAKCCMINC